MFTLKKDYSSETGFPLGNSPQANSTSLFQLILTYLEDGLSVSSVNTAIVQRNVGCLQRPTLIDDIRIPRRPWDERLHSMIVRLKRGTFWQKRKQTLVSRG